MCGKHIAKIYMPRLFERDSVVYMSLINFSERKVDIMDTCGVCSTRNQMCGGASGNDEKQ